VAWKFAGEDSWKDLDIDGSVNIRINLKETEC
jgi:hypothetical protein